MSLKNVKASSVVASVTHNLLDTVFHSLRPSTENAQRPHKFKCYDGTTSLWPALERRRCLCAICAISETGTQCNRHRGAVPMRQCRVKVMALYLTRSGMSSQWRLSCISCVKPRSNFLVPVRTWAAAFITRCSLLLMTFWSPGENDITAVHPWHYKSVDECCRRHHSEHLSNTVHSA